MQDINDTKNLKVSKVFVLQCVNRFIVDKLANVDIF